MKKFYCLIVDFLCVLSVGCSGLYHSAPPPDTTVSIEEIRKAAEAESGEMIKFLSKTIQYASVEDFGYELTPETKELMTFVLETGEKMGFTAKRAADGLVGVLEYGEGEESVGVLIHLDVVPVSKAELPQWTHPPFSGRVTDEEVWGRGAQDDKGALASVLWGAKFLIDNNITFKRKLRIILGTKEEKSFEGLTEYFKAFPQKEYGPTFGFVPDGAYISQGEKGIADVNYTFSGLNAPDNPAQRDSIVDWKGGTAVNTVPDFSYAVIRSRDVETARKELLDVIRQVTDELKSGKSDHCYGMTEPYDANLGLMDYQSFVDKHSPEGIAKGDLVLFSKGVSAHGSSPSMGKNSIVEVALAGSRMGQLSDNAYNRAFQFTAAKIGLSTDGSGLGIPFVPSTKLPPGPQPLTYYGTSANLGLVQVEAEDDRLVLKMNFRTGFENTNEQVIEGSMASASEFQGKAAYEEGVGSHYEPFYYTMDEPLLKLVINSYKEVNSDYPPELPAVFLIPATTYLKLVKNFIGFGPVDFYPDAEANYFHEKNERTTIKSQVRNSILYAYTLQKMIQMEKAPVR